MLLADFLGIRTESHGVRRIVRGIRQKIKLRDINPRHILASRLPCPLEVAGSNSSGLGVLPSANIYSL